MNAILVWSLVALLFLAVVSWGLYRSLRTNQRWAQSSAALGLSLEPFVPWRHITHVLIRRPPSVEQRMFGTRAGLQVCLFHEWSDGEARSCREAQEGPVARTWVAVELPRPLGLGLKAAPRASIARMLAFGRSEPPAGASRAEVLRERYVIRAHDLERAHALLETPGVLDSILSRLAPPFSFALTDRTVSARSRYGAMVTDPQALEAALTAAVDLAYRLEEARARLPPSAADRALAERWWELASSHGLALEPIGARRMSGRLDGVELEVSAERDERGWYTIVRAPFEQALGAGLSARSDLPWDLLSTIWRDLIQAFRRSEPWEPRQTVYLGDGRQRLPHWPWPTVETVPINLITGDASFDSRFGLYAADAHRAQQILTDRARAALLALTGPNSYVALDDQSLTLCVDGLPSEPGALERAMRAVAQAASALGADAAAAHDSPTA